MRRRCVLTRRLLSWQGNQKVRYKYLTHWQYDNNLYDNNLYDNNLHEFDGRKAD